MLLTLSIVITGVLAVLYYKRKRQIGEISKMLVPWARLQILDFTIYESTLTGNEFSVKIWLESQWVKYYCIILTIAFVSFSAWDEYVGVPRAAKEVDIVLFVAAY